MKNKLVSLLITIILFGGSYLSAQPMNINITVFEPLPEVSFMAFVTTKGLKNTPRIMQIDITPHGKEVTVKGSVLWRKIGEASFNEILNFTTKPFIAKNFYNDDISSINGIEIKENNSNDDLLQENLNKGKPTGTYRIIVEIIDENGDVLADDEEDIDFLNPAQTLSIIEPNVGDVFDIGGVILTWTDVKGVSDFYIKANTRSSKFETLEEVLQRGNPLVDNKNVGTKRSVNLREVLDRELVAGNEVVVQVYGSIPGPGGPTIIYSDIVNFKIKGASSVVVDKSVKELQTLASQVLDDLKNNGENDAAKRLQDLLDKIRNGTISFNDLSLRFADGRVLSYSEFQELLEYLRKNPDLVRSIGFEEK
jgi:hypothetical protein